MDAQAVTQLTGVTLKLSAQEARELYAELYRLSDKFHPWPVAASPETVLAGSMIAALMRELGKVGADA